jgi:glutathione S-transferase
VELYQAEWCPHSHRVRQRLTELGLDFLARQVPPEPDDRQAMRNAVGDESIPVLVDGRRTIAGDEDILAYLDERYVEPRGAAAHRDKAREEVPAFDEVASG